MPTYTYRRADGTTFEIEQRITEDALTVCPTTGQSVTRVITRGAGLVFKGSGFYLTDYARKGKGSAEPASDSSPTEKSTSENTSEGSKSATETKTGGGGDNSAA